MHDERQNKRQNQGSMIHDSFLPTCTYSSHVAAVQRNVGLLGFVCIAVSKENVLLIGIRVTLDQPSPQWTTRVQTWTTHSKLGVRASNLDYVLML